MNSIWIARDKNGRLNAFTEKPQRDETHWKPSTDYLTCFDWNELEESWFPELNWEDEPIELVIKEKED